MWMFTQTGFVSAVQHRTDVNALIVRSRDRQSLVELATLGESEILAGVGSDYPFRVICPRSVFSTWVQAQVDALEYGNFKNRVAQTRGYEFATVLSEVWSTAMALEDLSTEQPWT